MKDGGRICGGARGVASGQHITLLDTTGESSPEPSAGILEQSMRAWNRVVVPARDPMYSLSPNVKTFKEPKNRIQGTPPGCVAWRAGTATLYLLGS